MKKFLLLLLLPVALTAQTIRPTFVSQIQWTELTTAQESGMTLAEGSEWYNTDLNCFRQRLVSSTVCFLTGVGATDAVVKTPSANQTITGGFQLSMDGPLALADPGGVDDQMTKHGIATTTIPTEASLGVGDHVFIQYADTASPLAIRHFIYRRTGSVPEEEFLVEAYHHPSFIVENISLLTGARASFVIAGKGSTRWMMSNDATNTDTHDFRIRQFPLDLMRFQIDPVSAAVDIGVGTTPQNFERGNLQTSGFMLSLAQQNDTTGRAALGLKTFGSAVDIWFRTAGDSRDIEIATLRDGGITHWVWQNDSTGIIRAPSSGFVDHSDGLKIGGGTELTTSNQTGTGNLVLATSPAIVTPVIAVSNPLEGALSNSPRWIFKQVDFGDMTAAATADTFVLWNLPANTMIHDIVGIVVTSWSGGTISAAIGSVGVQATSDLDLALDDDFFAAGTIYELHDATASGGKGTRLFDTTDKFAPHMFVVGGNIRLQMDLTGDNHANATAGQARIHILVSQPLANTTAEAN